MHTIGLTGGICTGKSFVLKVFSELGCFTIRADDLSRAILAAKNSRMLKKIIAVAGPGIIDEQGGLNKERFSQIIFEDADKRQQINQIIHPQVGRERQKKIKEIERLQVYDFFIYESALLVEAGIYKDFEKVIVVYTSPEIQIQRLMARDHITAVEAEERIQAQFPLKEKLKVASYSIDTSGNLNSTRGNTCEVFHLLKRDFNLI